MTVRRGEFASASGETAVTSRESNRRLKFGGPSAFQVELRRRVDGYFHATGRCRRDCWEMYVKTAIVVACFAVSYVLLVFVTQTWLPALLLAILLGLSAAGIGFNTQHDGGHEAYSNYRWVNKLMAMTLDVIGGSSYLWHWKHVVFHHPYVNLAGHDTDINLGILARVTPHQKRLTFHRWQHLYLWPLYGLLTIKWQLVDDFRKLITGRIGGHRVPRPRKYELVILVAGKVIFFASAFGVPLLFHSLTVVLFYYGVAAVVAGVVLSTVFQLAHCLEGADFPLAPEGSRRIENAWAIHQVETTVNFARGSRLVTWLLGGLNFQIEHHLFPRISHVNYPAISRLVEETCRDFGVRYTEYPSFRAGLAAHFRWLRRMGRPNRSARSGRAGMANGKPGGVGDPSGRRTAPVGAPSAAPSFADSAARSSSVRGTAVRRCARPRSAGELSM
jgi:linoleoyl-CoA desaturase